MPGTLMKRPIAMRLQSKRDTSWVYKHTKRANIDETQFRKFADLWWAEAKNGKILTREQIGKLIQSVNDNFRLNGVNKQTIHAWVAAARSYFMKEKNETIIWISKQGYKIAEGAERPLHVGKIGHMALKWKYRFLDGLSILTIDEFKTAGAEMIRRIEKEMGGKQHSLAEREAIFALCKENLKTLRIEARDVK